MLPSMPRGSHAAMMTPGGGGGGGGEIRRLFLRSSPALKEPFVSPVHFLTVAALSLLFFVRIGNGCELSVVKPLTALPPDLLASERGREGGEARSCGGTVFPPWRTRSPKHSFAAAARARPLFHACPSASHDSLRRFGVNGLGGQRSH